jgi:hypothetical protein
LNKRHEGASFEPAGETGGLIFSPQAQAVSNPRRDRFQNTCFMPDSKPVVRLWLSVFPEPTSAWMLVRLLSQYS